MVTPDTGTNGQTSSAPIRGCSPVVRAHVDAGLGDAGGGEGALDDRLRRAHERVDRAVRGPARVHVEQRAAGRVADRLRDGVDDRAVAALGEVGDALDELRMGAGRL